jgi:hypothetical protein
MSIHVELEKKSKGIRRNAVFGGYEFKGRIPEMVG